jgi:predicted NAD/FAD-binding protein
VVKDSHSGSDTYDHVVVASHTDQALAMLSDPSDRERAILGDIRYAPNMVYLHRDVRLMPKRRRAWASWNFLRWQREGNTFNDVAVTYWMNRLQGIDDDKPLFVSLNPPFEPDQRSRLCGSEAARRDSGKESYLVLRRLDRLWIS